MKVTKRKYLSPRIKVKEIRPHLMAGESITGTPEGIKDDSEKDETFGDDAKQSYFNLWSETGINNDY